MMRNRSISVVTGVVAMVLCGSALSQEAVGTVVESVIDFKPILNELVLAVASVIGAALLYLAKLARDWFKAKTGVELQISDEQVRQVLDRAIQYGIAFVVGRFADRAQITVSNAQVAQIANYVIAAVPGALKQFGITPERLQDMIRARIVAWTDGNAVTEPALPAPATP
jgi:hypothetical protein